MLTPAYTKLISRRRFAATKGFTLLEVVVALAVILGALIGPVALVTRGLFDFSLIKNKLVALNLAQEGIEVVRAVRENNILCQTLNTGYAQDFNTGYSWITNSNGTGLLTDNLGVGRKVSAIAQDPITCWGKTIQNPRTNISGNCSTDTLTLDGQGQYGYGGPTPTIFARCVFINALTADEDGIPANQMIDIISRVAWPEHGISRSVELRERLYKWKYPLSN